MKTLTPINDVVLTKPPKVKPKHLSFLQMYYLPSSPTIGNVYQSAIAAGFSKSYARVMTVNARNLQWLADAKQYMTRLEVDHIRNVLEDEMLHSKQSRDRIRAAELLGKHTGMFIDQSISQVNVSFTNNVPRPIVPPIIEGESPDTGDNKS